jgi:hypothetical protein
MSYCCDWVTDITTTQQLEMKVKLSKCWCSYILVVIRFVQQISRWFVDTNFNFAVSEMTENENGVIIFMVETGSFDLSSLSFSINILFSEYFKWHLCIAFRFLAFYSITFHFTSFFAIFVHEIENTMDLVFDFRSQLRIGLKNEMKTTIYIHIIFHVLKDSHSEKRKERKNERKWNADRRSRISILRVRSWHPAIQQYRLSWILFK